MKKIKKYLMYILIILLIAIEVFFVVKKEFQNDTFYSIRVGEIVLNNGINSLDIDSISWHNNLKYCNPHWLNDVIIYISFNLGQYFGVYLLTLIVTFILAILIFYISNRYSKNKWISCVITLITLYLMRIFIAARAQLVSYILFLLEIYFIEQYISSKKIRYLIRIMVNCFGISQYSHGCFSNVFCFFTSIYCRRNNF